MNAVSQLAVTTPATTAVSPDAELLGLCDKAALALLESDLLGSETDDMLVSDPQFKPLSDAARASYLSFIAWGERAAEVPTTTIAGMRAKAALTLQAIPRSVLDDHRVVYLLLADMAGLGPAEIR